jgi:hypothetical protein
VTACFCLGLVATALAAETPQAAAVHNPLASTKNYPATKPMLLADVPRWRHRQIAAAQPVTGKNTTFRRDEILGTEVCSPQNEALGSIETTVMSLATNAVAYLVVALNPSFGKGDVSVPVPLEDFKITPNGNLLVLATTGGVLEAAPRVSPFSADGIDLQNHKVVDRYWKAHLSNKGFNRLTK